MIACYTRDMKVFNRLVFFKCFRSVLPSNVKSSDGTLLDEPVQCFLWVPGGGLSIALPAGAFWSEVIGFFRPIKIKNKYYIVYNNSI